VGADDRELVDRFLASHDEGAFRELYRAHAPRLYRLALRLTRGVESEAQDLVQETWMRATAKLRHFRWQAKLSTWLGSIVINAHRESLRRQAGEAKRIADARTRLSVVGAATRDVSPDLERAIADLPDGQREVLVLHDIEGYTHHEIAELLGVAEGTSKSQLSRARDAMRTWLSREGASLDAK